MHPYISSSSSSSISSLIDINMTATNLMAKEATVLHSTFPSLTFSGTPLAVVGGRFL